MITKEDITLAASKYAYNNSILNNRSFSTSKKAFIKGAYWMLRELNNKNKKILLNRV